LLWLFVLAATCFYANFSADLKIYRQCIVGGV